MSLLLLGVTRPEYVGVIDAVGVSAEVAYGLRKLRTAYAGSAIRVRRSTDNAESDIGFLSNGDLDTTSLLAFVNFDLSLNAGFIVTWYDQSGNARNVTQPTAGDQPVIVNAGLVVTQNGRSTSSFNGSNQFVRAASATATMLTVNAVAKQATTGVTGVFIAHNNNVSGTQWFLRTEVADIFIAIKTATVTSSVIVDTTSQVYTGLASNGTNSELFRSGTSVGTGTTLGAGATSGQLNIGASPLGGRFFNGNIFEVLVFASNLTTTQRQAMERNQGTYYGITVA